MKKNNKLFPLFAFCVFTLATTAVAFASSGEEAHTPLWKDYMWKIINFGVLIIILWKFGKTPVQNALRQRTELIEKTLKEAKEAKEAALKAMQEVEQKLKTKDEEIKAIVAAAQKSGELERTRIIEESARLQAKIIEQAKTNIEFELKHAKEVIKAEAVELAMELAEKKLKEKMTKEEQEKLLEDSLVKIGGRG
ncbi:MAG: F0F1 ATP synthase subunit B [Thermodesulfovibrionales bacterium]|nr:F0F1 ATP synthase subunit B [Thermodesulfovibrionales bacterium]